MYMRKNDRFIYTVIAKINTLIAQICTCINLALIYACLCRLYDIFVSSLSNLF